MRGWRNYWIEIALIAVLGAAVAYFGYLGYGLLAPSYAVEPFSGERALYYVTQQLENGPRVSGTEAGAQTADWLAQELSSQGWDVIIQSYAVTETLTARNIIAHAGDGTDAGQPVIVSTHYDTRAMSDRDPDEADRSQATPGANAGASGPAVLLELARTLDLEETGHPICLVFLDGEDNGGLPGWDYAMGSAEFLQRIETDTPQCSFPRAAVYLDLVGGSNANMAGIGPAAESLVDTLRRIAGRIGYEDAFRGPHVRDDLDALTRYSEAGIPAVMLADLGYDYRHTTDDTLDKISADTLQKVGDVLKSWLEDGAPF